MRRINMLWTKHNTLYEYQYGFRKNHSTTLILIEITGNIYKWLDDQNSVICLYLDLEKAFDTVNHDILLNKLYVLNWFRSYLTNRLQFTALIEGIISSTMPVTCGVPQGSVLGPILFLVYVNDLSNASPLWKIRLFADDTNIFLYGKDMLKLYDTCTRRY